MTRRLLAGALLAAVALGFAPAPFLKKGPPTDDPAALNGVWEALTVELTSGVVTRYKGTSFAHFSGDKLTFLKDPKGTTGVAYKIVIDAKARPPMLDLQRDGVGKGGGAILFRGRYQIEGNKLLFIYTSGGQPRPDGMKPTTPSQHLMTFQRVKPTPR